MKNTYLVIGIGLVVALMSMAAIAQNEGDKPMAPGAMPGGMPGMMQRGGPGRNFSEAAMALRLKEKLVLTAEQVTKLEALVAKTETADKAVQEKRDALHKAVQAKALEAAIRAAATELGVKLGDQAVLQVSSDAEVGTILTAAQKATVEEIKAKRQERRDRDGLGNGPDAAGPAGERKARDPEADFSKIDSDGNKAISLEEFKAYTEQMKQRRGGGGPADGPAK
jgi:Spy/CpxP family protein refolding chaperone